MNRHSKVSTFFVLGLLLTAGLFVGCKGGKKAPVEKEDTAISFVLDHDAIMQDIEQAEKVFNALPSPVESAMLIKSAGAEYNEALLNPISNASSYVTNRAMALNLGVYTCDLSFSSMYEQTQLLIDYMNAAKKMADGLGILDAIAQEDIDRLEENINDSEVIMDIVSQTFMNSNSYLEENGQPATAAMVLLGGWIEGFYISTQLVNMDNFANDKLVGRIVDQKFSIDILLNLLADSRGNQAVDELIDQVNELKTVFDKVTVETSAPRPVYDEVTQSTVIKSESKVNITKEVFNELTTTVSLIRNSFINP
ncbi:MAG: hypothetical protein ACOX5K_01235 [Bacteroidales bacterium]|jgi:archaellum component FlaC